MNAVTLWLFCKQKIQGAPRFNHSSISLGSLDTDLSGSEFNAGISSDDESNDGSPSKHARGVR